MLNLNLDAFCPTKHKFSIKLWLKAFCGKKASYTCTHDPSRWLTTSFCHSFSLGHCPEGQCLLRVHESQGNWKLIIVTAKIWIKILSCFTYPENFRNESERGDYFIILSIWNIRGSGSYQPIEGTDKLINAVIWLELMLSSLSPTEQIQLSGHVHHTSPVASQSKQFQHRNI